MIVFDLYDKDSFKKTRNWIMNIQEKIGEDVVIVLVGNKLDMENEEKFDITR